MTNTEKILAEFADKVMCEECEGTGEVLVVVSSANNDNGTIQDEETLLEECKSCN